jgi:hypothetical protein
MSTFWLTPVLMNEQTTVLSAGRMELVPQEARESLLALLKSVHPGMLILFKSNLLLSEDAEAACGVDELPFELQYTDEDIVFEQDELELSHCAQAYLDRLASVNEMSEWLRAAAIKLSMIQGSEHSPESGWIQAMQSWSEQGKHIILLREDG